MESGSLQRVGGACAILYGIVVAAALSILAGTGLIDAVGAAEILPILESDKAMIATAGWLFVLAPILVAVAGLSFFQALRQAGPLMPVALLTFVGGGFLILCRSFIWLALTYALAPAYAGAAEGTRGTLVIVGDTLVSFGFMAELAVGVLIAGIGVPLFSFAVLRTTVARRWVAWLGFPVALLGGWFTLLAPAAEVFEILSFIGAIGFLLWMVAMGVALWRASEPGGV